MITVGETINNWLVLDVAGHRKDGHKRYLVRCQLCGHTAIVASDTIRTLSKGTCQHPKHTMLTNKRLHTVFDGMLDRCYNSRNKAFRNYGGKGVTICDEWLNNPKSFENWALAHGYEEKLTIDRIDSNKDYSPANCKEADASVLPSKSLIT